MIRLQSIYNTVRPFVAPGVATIQALLAAITAIFHSTHGQSP
jgi:hypothetical protein